MKFTPGLENEDSFMIIPNEFIKDYSPTIDEIRQFMMPDHEYEEFIRAKYGRGSIFKRIGAFIASDRITKIVKLKKFMNRILGRKLPDIEYVF